MASLIPDIYNEAIRSRLLGMSPVAPSRMMPATQATAPVMPTGQPEDPYARLNKMYADADASAGGIDPRIAAMLERRMGRISEQEADAAKMQKRAPWEALARAGAAMAGSQSPFFGQALSAGLTTGIDALNESRANAIKRRASFGDARDEVEMQRIQQEGAGRKAAREDVERRIKLAGDISTADKAAAEAAVARMRADPRNADAEYQLLVAKIGKEKADIALTQAQIRTEGAQAFKYTREGMTAGQSGDGTGSNAGESLSEEEKIARNLDPDLPWIYDAKGIVRLPTGFKAPPGQRGSVPPEVTLKTIEAAKLKLPEASSGGVMGTLTRGMEMLGKSTDRSKADAQLRVIAGQLTAAVPRFEGPQALPEVKLYQAMAADVANSDLPTESRLAALGEMERMIRRNMAYKEQKRGGGAAAATEKTATGPNGEKLVLRNGQWVRK